ncbi:LysR family transcriptional regulator [Clostridium sp. MSJ-11]|uniref:LysR family transcriptional regulator n=1 Tax=Clostridium mobile TaxID=2841512 RepID=A0ABS6EK18_9CLOT|nr:LysR family transcriptional regulator [Clostridium mobile]MBU5485137.1 LysR family transcriptional regulator [Clostridium mobile]
MLDFRIISFIVVGKVGNITKAANILNITQPAVSQHLKWLEEYYNVKLFIKKNKKMMLTEEGKYLFDNAIKMESMSKNIKYELKNRRSIIKKYRIGATLTIGGYVLPNIIGEYKKIYNNIDIIMKVENTETVVKLLHGGEIDLGIVEGAFNKSNLKYKKFREDELALIVSPEHEFADMKEVSIEQVLNNKLILREKGSGTRQAFQDYVIEAGLEEHDINPYMEIGNITAILSLVKSNLGCTILSRESVKDDEKRGLLKIVPIKKFHMTREFNFIYIDNFNEEFVDHFLKFCVENDLE